MEMEPEACLHTQDSSQQGWLSTFNRSCQKSLACVQLSVRPCMWASSDSCLIGTADASGGERGQAVKAS